MSDNETKTSVATPDSDNSELESPTTGGDAPQLIAEPTLGDVMGAITELSKDVKKNSADIHRIKTGGVDDFKDEAIKADVEKASEGRENIDPRIVKIVDEMLGEDFKIDIEHFDDKPGLLFTLIVPNRLSEKKVESRPVPASDKSRDYKRSEDGEVLMEDYTPEDRRSRAISSLQSYDAIRDHCEKVRSYIVAYYQKMNKPIPDFRVKDYGV